MSCHINSVTSVMGLVTNEELTSEFKGIIKTLFSESV